MISSCDDRLYVKHICSGIIKEDPPTIPIIILPIKTVPIQLVVEPRAYNSTHLIIFTMHQTIRIDLKSYRLKKKTNKWLHAKAL